MFKIFAYSLLFVSTISAVSAGCAKPTSTDFSYSLTGTSIVWPDENTKSIFSSSGRYFPRNIIGTKMKIHKDNAIIALPRLKPGVPMTLGIMSLAKRQSAGLLPFPCWSIQEEGNCEALQTVVDIALDIQDILWVLDVGVVNTLTQPVFRCGPKVVGIDVNTGKVVKTIDLSHLVTSLSRLQELSVDYPGDGSVFLYIADAASRAIIVYDVVGNHGFRVSLPPEVNLGNSRRDVLYTALIRKPDGNTVLYFTYLNSGRVFAIKTEDLRKGVTTNVVSTVGVKSNKIVFLGTNDGSAIFFRYKGQSDIYMWDTNTAFSPENFVLVNKGSECRLPTMVSSGPKETMWTLESNFQDYIQNTVSASGPSMVVKPLLKNC
ncbi:major royal jelly protein 1 [Chelonus insularis]|uniref:major royal jelly protein 1 n=1 Tax=Chelonus insularis TaxID=460826 RepID=UPI00158AE2EF|nr:major royal jelly protein 1 [Chelonus insularis]